MAFLRQTWTLTKKNLLVVLVRHWFFTTIRAFIAPIIFMFFISYAKNFFVPPSEYGIGSPRPIRTLQDALGASQGNRNKVVFVNNGHTGGDIEAVINNLSATILAAGKTAEVVDQDIDLLTSCQSSLRGASTCFGAVSFHASPTEGNPRTWNYTLRADGSLGERIFVHNGNNDAQIYILPFQRAIDTAIGTISRNASTTNVASSITDIEEYPFTDETAAERAENIRHLYMGALINILAVAFYIGVCGVTYQLTGQMASERELGISQLVEAMTPTRSTWHIQAARLLSTHLAFDIIYLPGWIIMAAILREQAFPTTSMGILIVFHILAGLSLSSFSIFGASFFRKAQLSGITITILAIVLAIVAQVSGPFATGATAVLSLLFPSMNYVFFIIYVARFERQSEACNLVKSAPENPSTLPGIAFWVFLIVQIFLFPLLGALVERWLYGTVSKERKMRTSSPEHAIVLSNFSKHWKPSWFRRVVLSKFGIKVPETVMAVNDLSIKVRSGQILVLLGANGSGKSTTLDAISGLNTITNGSIEIDGTGGLGLCPQKNVIWDELTVFEHVQIFNKLKATGDTDNATQIEDLIRACDLGHKIKAKAYSLSGGQKRKLQLAMMFTGGSRVCCVDEVSSGLDPLSRRKIWDILLAERGERTFLMTTHFLDEADVLSDYVAILSKGNLKAKGTSVQLKHQVGAGYRISVPKDQQVKSLSGTKSTTADGTKVVYWLPDSSEASKLIGELRANSVTDYDIVGPTLEDVFLALAEEVRENKLELDGDALLKPKGVVGEDDSSTLPASDSSSKEDISLQISKGHGTSIAKQTLILVKKRLTILKRNYLPYCAAVLLPVITAGLVTLFLDGFEALGCSPGDQSTNPTSTNLGDLSSSLLIPLGPPGIIDPNAILASGLNTSSFHFVDTLDDFNNYVSANFHDVIPGGFFLNAPSVVMAYIGNDGVAGGFFTLNALDNLLENVNITSAYQSFAVPFAPGAGDTLQLILYFGLAMSVYPAFFALYPCLERLRNVRALHYSNGIRAAPLWLAYLIFDFLFVLLVSAVVTGIFVGTSDVWYAPGYLFVVFALYGLTSILLCYVVSLFTSSQLACFAFAAGGQAVFFLLYFIMYMSILTYSPPYRLNTDLTVSNFAYSVISPAASLIRTLLLALNEFSLLCRDTSIASYPGAITVYGGPILYLIVQAVIMFTVLVWYDSGYKPAFLNSSKQKHAPDAEDNVTIDPEITNEVKRVEASNDSLRVLHLNKWFKRNHAVQDMTFGIPRGQVFALLGPNGAGKSSTISLIRGDIHPSRSGGGGGDVLIEELSISARRAAARGHLGVCPQFDAMDSMTVREHLTFYARARGVPDIENNVVAMLSATGLVRFKDRLAHKLSGGNKRKLSLGIALMGNPEVMLLDEPSSGMDAAAKRVMWRTLLGIAAPGRALLITTHSMEEADKLATRVGIMKRRMLAVGTSRELGERWGDSWVVHLVLKSAPRTTEEEMDAIKRWITANIPGVVLEKWGARGGGHGQLRFRVLKGSRAQRLEMMEEEEDRQKQVDGPEESPVSDQYHDAVTSPVKATFDDRTGEKAGNTGMAEEDVTNTGPHGHATTTTSRAGNGKPSSASSELDIPGLIQLLELHREELGLEYYSISPTTLDEVFLRVVGEDDEDNGPKEKKGGSWWKFR